MERVRIRTLTPPDGCLPTGHDVEVMAIGDDGSETPIIAQRVSIEMDASGGAVRATIVVVNVELDVVAEVS